MCHLAVGGSNQEAEAGPEKRPRRALPARALPPSGRRPAAGALSSIRHALRSRAPAAAARPRLQGRRCRRLCHTSEGTPCSPLVHSPHTAPRPRSPPPAFPDAIPGPTTWTSRSCIAGSATPTCTWRATSGRDGPPSTRCVPGHEIVGRVTEGGRQRHQASRRATWRPSAAWSDPAGRARSCKDGLEQYCDTGGTVFTYNSAGSRRHRARHLRRLLGRDRRQLAFRAARLAEAGPGGGRAAAVRRHHALLAAEALGRGPGQEGGDRRPRRPRPHGRQVRARVRRAHGAVHDVAVEDRGRQAPGRGRRRGVEERRRDGEAHAAAST